MSWVCDLTNKRGLVGHKVSHANNKTKYIYNLTRRQTNNKER